MADFIECNPFNATERMGHQAPRAKAYEPDPTNHFVDTLDTDELI